MQSTKMGTQVTVHNLHISLHTNMHTQVQCKYIYEFINSHIKAYNAYTHMDKHIYTKTHIHTQSHKYMYTCTVICNHLHNISTCVSHIHT